MRSPLAIYGGCLQNNKKLDGYDAPLAAAGTRIVRFVRLHTRVSILVLSVRVHVETPGETLIKPIPGMPASTRRGNSGNCVVRLLQYALPWHLATYGCTRVGSIGQFNVSFCAPPIRITHRMVARAACPSRHWQACMCRIVRWSDSEG